MIRSALFSDREDRINEVAISLLSKNTRLIT
jgi:hypothetical protein